MSATAASRSRALSVGRSVFVAAVAALLLALVGVCASPAHATSGQPGLGVERCDAAGAATAPFAYDAWGRRTADFGSEAGTLGFAGQVTEPGTDLQFLRARYYDPRTAQFISRDAKEVSTGQPYLYAAGNPAMFTDPTGESIFDGLDDFLGGVQSGASFGKSKPGYANRCAWLNVIGQQLGGFADPLRKIRAGGTIGAKAIDEILPTPELDDVGRLRNIVDNLYKGTTNERRVGDGTTMDAVRRERATGDPVHGKTHTTKAQDSLNGLRKWLSNTPNASDRDKRVARSLIQELETLGLN